MEKINAINERIKREYYDFMKESKQLGENSLDAVNSAIHRFDSYNKCKDFKAYHYEQAIGFKKHLASEFNQRTGKPLSKTTQHAILNNLRKFFEWLSYQPGYKSKIIFTDASYFNMSLKDSRVAKASQVKAAPSCEQVKHVISMMPSNTAIELRNRALIAFSLLTAARVGALASAKLRHIDLAEKMFFQDAKEVNTKFSKTFPTYFFPVGDDIVQIVLDWINYLKNEMLWSLDDPLFPATKIKQDDSQRFEPVGLERRHWSSTSPIRAIFKEAFTDAGLPNFNPHSFRNTLTRLGQTMCKGSGEALKAWSQNLGHESMMMTSIIYGAMSYERQGEIMKSSALQDEKSESEVERIAEAVARKLKASDK